MFLTSLWYGVGQEANREEKDGGNIRIEQSDVAYHNNTYCLTAGFAVTRKLWDIQRRGNRGIYDQANSSQKGGIQFEIVEPELNYVKRVISHRPRISQRCRNSENIKCFVDAAEYFAASWK